MYEGDLFLVRPLFWIPRTKSGWLERWELWNQAPSRHKLDASRLPSRTHQVRPVMERAYQLYARQKGAPIWGDKTVNSYNCLVEAASNFPNARFIMLWRDPVAIYRSVIKAAQSATWFADRSGMIYRLLMGHKALKTERDRLVSRGARIHEIYFEDLVNNPVATLTGICEFLGIPFVPAMADLGGADRSAISEGDHHHMVKSERIVSSLDRPEVVPARVKRKIERYVALWQEESGGLWPLPPGRRSCDSEKPSALERLCDQFIYRCLRTMDFLVVILYCYAPLALLRRFRAFKRRRARGSALKAE